MKKIIRIAKVCVLGTVLFSLLYSCEDYLNVRSNMGLVIPDNLKSLRRLLDASQNMNMSICSEGEVASDDYFLLQSTYNSFTDENKARYIWRNFDYVFTNDWGKAYNVIYNANLVLDQLAKIERTEQNRLEWDDICGSAYYFRGTHYLSLLWTFAKAYDENTSHADLGIVLRNSSDFNQPSVRSTVQDGYDAVMDDLVRAAELLPEVSDYVTRPTQVSAYATIARAYLSMRDYEQALFYANKVLQYGVQLLDYNDAESVRTENAYPIPRFNKETLMYFELSVNVPINVPNFMVDTALLATYADSDMRKKLFYKLTNDGYATFRGSYAEGTKLFAGITAAEIYLIKAECLARNGDYPRAVEVVSKFISNRYETNSVLPLSFSDEADVLPFILEERRKELVFRGVRWSDIKRLNIEGSGIGLVRKINGEEYRLPPNDDRFAIPLPSDIIAITGMPQNPH